MNLVNYVCVCKMSDLFFCYLVSYILAHVFKKHGYLAKKSPLPCIMHIASK